MRRHVTAAVVAVAHAGGVDPEAAASTVEMRSALLRETCSLLKLKNVRLKPAHAVIDGELAPLIDGLITHYQAQQLQAAS